jgi:hypothetical protein
MISTNAVVCGESVHQRLLTGPSQGFYQNSQERVALAENFFQIIEILKTKKPSWNIQFGFLRSDRRIALRSSQGFRSQKVFCGHSCIYCPLTVLEGHWLTGLLSFTGAGPDF